MESQRQQKISGVIQKDLAEIFQHEIAGMFSKTPLITITRVLVTKDLSIAKVAVSLFAIEDKESFLNEIKAHSSEIRYLLGKRIGKQMRVVPELQFYHDDSLDFNEHIDKLINE